LNKSNNLKKPPRLAPGATLGIAAISGAVDRSKLEAGLGYLRGRGYRLVEASNLRSVHRDFAGRDEERARGYRELLCDPRVDAILFARGGWGAARALSWLDPEEIAAHPKIHMGGSDLTSFFSFLRLQAGLVAFHGPMVASDFARQPVDPETDAAWEPVLRGELPGEVRIEPSQVVAPGAGGGPLAGGCLSILASLEGTPEALPAEPAVLFWEDVGEEIYRLDRMLCQLKRAGKFERLAGAIIGKLESITRAGNPDETALTELLSEYFAGSPYPVLRDWPAGHGRRNRAMAFGARVEIDTFEGAVRFVEAGVQ
jgi:muramoyltetrapeptide carboxypeptidase